MTDNWYIGVIGGSGLSEGIGLDQAETIEVSSPFGEASGPVTLGTISGIRFAFLARHGAGHSVPPESVNYRANVDVLKRCGVTDLLALSAVGSLRSTVAPGGMVTVDQFIDRTTGRVNSFFGAGLVAHVSLADPTCSRLSGLIGDAAEAVGATVQRRGTYVAIDGPQFSTRAESQLYRKWGGDVIGMTGMPEARLAREAELPYALLAMATDYDCWRDGEEAETAHILATMQANSAIARNALIEFARALPATREAVAADTALDGAIATAKPARDPALIARLDAVAGRVLR